jgi:hypothetical protein
MHGRFFSQRGDEFDGDVTGLPAAQKADADLLNGIVERAGAQLIAEELLVYRESFLERSDGDAQVEECERVSFDQPSVY